MNLRNHWDLGVMLCAVKVYYLFQFHICCENPIKIKYTLNVKGILSFKDC